MIKAREQITAKTGNKIQLDTSLVKCSEYITKGALTIGTSSNKSNTLLIYPGIAEKVTTQSKRHFGTTIH
ncbi:hypothetical protein [Gilliamella apicola]|uniref:hypothetical protein n=1 Tax=Gilliamella apicola TaxID=1196095 RepID=UPI00080E580C|nr:hypothetical protein [Gilliamella apicola]OCG11354.1 hypothetical protein A9G14_08380 [Gilliamella apicola]ORF44664.1 hypothetical protein B5800_10885 [Gilliamella apicola]ORF48090.1 hypothetical protein B5799_09980 [Gilliamella apicola]ORF50886.1 hypothetical protein B5803_08550 [Gilliamella apicola]ORF54115.1 hypothetical protein B5798_07335 [Gilliamella apicola]